VFDNMIDNPNRNIRKHYNKYQISKYFNGKVYYYGTFHKLEDARKVRDVLEEVNWGLPPLDMKHIQKEGDYWRVRKISCGETVWDALYKTLEEAIGERDLLVANDWDVDNL
jgi:hypothetical protein